MQSEQQQRIMGYFIEEAKEHLNTIERGLLNLQSTLEDPEAINEVFRAAHSVKGGAAMLGLNGIQQVGHRLEDYFKVLKESNVQIDQRIGDLLLSVFDVLRDLLDQLQSPFGLTEEFSNTALTSMQPTVVELEQHLAQLAGGVPISTLEPVAVAAAPNNRELIEQSFRVDVPARLRDMLQCFKRPETDEASRQQLQTLCAELTSLGDRCNLPEWCALIEVARQAIACADNSYRTLAPIVIKDLKQAQELVLAERFASIIASAQLQDLVPAVSFSEPSETMVQEDLSDFLTDMDAVTEVSAITPQVDPFADFAAADFTASDANLQLTNDSTSHPVDIGALVPEMGNDIDLDEPTHQGPEVGMAELNTLADLFEGEVPELGLNWQEEQLQEDDIDPFATSVQPDNSSESSDDFSDLLMEEDGGILSRDVDSSSSTTTPISDEEDDDLIDLLAVASESDLSSSFSVDDLGLGSDELDDGGVGELDSPSDDPFSSDRESDLTLEISGLEETAISDDLDNLFDGLEEPSLASSTESDDLWADSNAGDLSPAALSSTADDSSLSDPWGMDDLSSAIDESQVSSDSFLTNGDESTGDQADLDDFFGSGDLGLGSFDLGLDAELDIDIALETASTASADELSLESAPEQSREMASSSLFEDDAQTDSAETISSDLWSESELSEIDLALLEPSTSNEGVQSDLAASEGELSLDSLSLSNEVPQLSLTGDEDALFLNQTESLGSDTQIQERDSALDLDNLTIDDFSTNELAVISETEDADLADLLLLDDASTSEDLLSLDIETQLGDLTATSTSGTASDLEDLFGASGFPEEELETSETWLDQPQEDFSLELLDLSSDDNDLDDFNLDEAIAPQESAESTDWLSELNLADPLAPALDSDDAELSDTEFGADLSGFTDESLTGLDSDFDADLSDLAADSNLTGLDTLMDFGEMSLGDEPSATTDLLSIDGLEANSGLDEDWLAENLPSDESLADLDDFLSGSPLSTEDQKTELLSNENNDAALSEGLGDLNDLWSNGLDDDLLSESEDTPALDRADPGKEYQLDSSDAVADLSELDNLLVDDATSDTADISIDLDSFLLEENTSGAIDEFADLDALLESDGSESGSDGASTLNIDIDQDDFADLEVLLGEDDSTTTSSSADSSSDDEFGASAFGDLDQLLQQAEQTMGRPPSMSVPRGAQAPARVRPVRMVDQTMRVPVKQLDNLSNLVGELVVNRNSLEEDQERLRQSLDNLLYQVQQLSDVGQRMQDLYERSLLESSLLASRQGRAAAMAVGASETNNQNTTGIEYDPLEMDRFTGFHSLSQEMIELIVRVRESSSDIGFIVDETEQVTRMFRQVTTQLQEGLTRSRMVPFAQTAERLPRAIRDISSKVGKQAEAIIEGKETLIDKMILEKLYDPLTHLVNNAITHGIESPEVRRSAGKPPVGQIAIRAFHQGNQTIISVSDDGGGIDIERVKAKAIEKRLITPTEARTMSRLDLYDLLFHPGFSTKDQADDFAGRGVGMDVVRTSLSEIRGVINTDSTTGKGTTFTIRLPLTLSISKALCCISDRARIAFPMDGVEDMLDLPKERIQKNADEQSAISWRDSMLPVRPLSELLSYSRHISRGNVYGGNQEEDIVSIVVLRSAGNFLALQVDQVIGEQEIVIKQLDGPVPKPVGVAGATVLGDGRIMPIADVLELIDLSVGRIRRDVGSSLWDQGGAQAVPESPAAKTEPMVLIVDDSITVRELLSMTFNKVGYRVEQARDGQEAWEKLRSGLPCDIVFCDIEMPRMDGLELLSRIQKDPNLKQLPIAMLTSRGADRHRQMAASLGASGYFTKPYLEEALLDAAQRMLKGEQLLSS